MLIRYAAGLGFDAYDALAASAAAFTVLNAVFNDLPSLVSLPCSVTYHILSTYPKFVIYSPLPINVSAVTEPVTTIDPLTRTEPVTSSVSELLANKTLPLSPTTERLPDIITEPDPLS